MQQPAPIALFAFNRPDHLKLTLTALAANDLAAESDLFVFCDGPRSEAEKTRTSAVREVAHAAFGFRSTTVIAKERNQGLAASIISGVTQLVEQYGVVIVLEDDLVTSPHFLRYMNDGLKIYADNPIVASIHGWCFSHDVSDPPETFFLPGADCWGWATWKRAWDKFEPDAGKLLTEINRRSLAHAFDINGAYGYTSMLKDALEGRVDSWAIRWHASAYLATMYTLYPSRTLVRNIGLDASGTHCGKAEKPLPQVSTLPVSVERQEVVTDIGMRHAQASAYTSQPALLDIARARRKARLKIWLPPALLALFRQIRHRKSKTMAVRWQGDYSDWKSAVAASGGYNHEEIFTKASESARAVREGRALWDRDSALFYHEEYNWPLLASLMAIAARNHGSLSVMDFGGALGSTYRQHKIILDTVPQLMWNIIEQPHFVRCGQAEFTTDAIQFWHSMEECAEASPPDVILFSSVLQYLEDPYAILAQAAVRAPQAIVLDRIPFAEKGERITVQHVPSVLYTASYPCRWLDRERVNAVLEGKYRLLPDFQTHIDPPGFYGIIAMKRDPHGK
jgi:putative methyltransferase (TIGR04325 family)